MSTPPEERLTQLLKKEAQLKARIQQVKARLDTKAEKAHTARLISWGMVVEKLLQTGKMSRTQWAENCRASLSEYRLKVALADFPSDPEPASKEIIAAVGKASKKTKEQAKKPKASDTKKKKKVVPKKPKA